MIYAEITVPGYYYDELVGIWGNNNQRIEDDFITKNGKQLQLIINGNKQSDKLEFPFVIQKIVEYPAVIVITYKFIKMGF